MRHARVLSWLLLPLLLGLPGCDVAVGVYFATKKKSSHSTASNTPQVDTSYFVWVADLTGVTDATEQGAIATAGGNPTAKWQLLGSGTQSAEFTMPVGTFNGILIQTTTAQDYHLDAFEILDAPKGSTIGTAGAVLADQISGAGTAIGYPNGDFVVMTATATNKAFVFMHHSSPITNFRVNLWKPSSRSEGDLEWVQTFPRTGDQTAGGAGVNALGEIFLTYRDEGTLDQWLRKCDASGTPVSTINLQTSVTSNAGMPAVAVSSNNVFAASNAGAGDIVVQKYSFLLAPQWGSPHTFIGTGVDRVEANGLSITSNGDVLIAGGSDAGVVAGIDHWLRRLDGSTGGEKWTRTKSDTQATHWYAVTNAVKSTAPGTDEIFSAGDQFLVNTEMFTLQTIDNNLGTVSDGWSEQKGDGASPSDRAQAIGVDSAFNVYVAGFIGRSATGKDSVILKYPSIGSPGSIHFDPKLSGADELFDLVVEADGTIYAVGYETLSGQGEDLVLLKIAPNGGLDWKRTLHNGVGNDRGISVMTTTTHVIVVGEVTVAASNRDIHVRKYVK
jgi:hypothetical protein